MAVYFLAWATSPPQVQADTAPPPLPAQPGQAQTSTSTTTTTANVPMNQNWSNMPPDGMSGIQVSINVDDTGGFDDPFEAKELIEGRVW